jgi:hypothetical protein
MKDKKAIRHIYKTNSKMTEVNHSLLVITININWISFPTKDRDYQNE